MHVEFPWKAGNFIGQFSCCHSICLEPKDFSPVKHGIFKLKDEDTLSKMICGNVVMHTSDSAKTSIEVSNSSLKW